MIEINLLPNARKKSRANTSARFDLGAFMGSMSARFKDPWLGVAVGGVVIGVIAVGAMWFLQGKTESSLREHERIAVQDSARFSAVVAQRRAAEAQRDSISRQISIISSLDGDRFIWPHIMEEISRALPTYTWLTSIAQANPAATANPAAVVENTAPPLAITVIGITVDIQALTVFMKQLEASPFLGNVTLRVSEVAVAEGKQVTEFTLEMIYTEPDESVIRTVPLTVAVR